MTKTQTYEDLSNAEVDAAKKRITNLKQSLADIKEQISDLNYEKTKLNHDLMYAQDALEETRKQAGRLKKFVWQSDNPNMIELRNEILLAAKLIYDPNPSKGKK